MPPTDTGTFNRLLTSLGLFCISAALVIPYFFFKNTVILSTPTEELEELTPQGRDALLDRQAAITCLEPWVIVLAIILAIGGVALVVIGAKRLWDTQVSEDEEAELRKDKARAEIRNLTPEEEAAKRSLEAREETPEEQRPAVPPAESSGSQMIALNKETIKRIEHQMERAFQGAALDGYHFTANLGIRSTVGAVEIDGLFSSPESEREDIVLELKVSRHPQGLVRSIGNRARDALAQISRFNSVAVQHSPVWLVLVVASEDEAPVAKEDLRRAEERASEILLDRGAATILRQGELNLLPEKFLRLLREGKFDANFL